MGNKVYEQKEKKVFSKTKSFDVYNESVMSNLSGLSKKLIKSYHDPELVCFNVSFQ